MKTKVFESISGLELIVKSRKSAVIFELDPEQNLEDNYLLFEFQPNDFSELITYLETISNESWSNVTPKEATSSGSDYWEYYDKELDNNGYLSLKKNALQIGKPFPTSTKLYQFNKRKMEAFLFDTNKEREGVQL